MKASDTLAAVNYATECRQVVSFREHLGASILGRECARSIWYTHHWAVRELHEARVLRLFDRGHKEEPRIYKWLLDAGFLVWVKDEAGNQYGAKACNGHFGLSLDGVVYNVPELPGTYCTLECKTHNDKSFKKLVEKGVAVAKFEHYVQMQLGMLHFKLPWSLYFSVNKNDDDIYAELVPYDAETANKYMERAQLLIDSPEPPQRISEDSSWFVCKFCPHRNICHGDDVPVLNCRTCTHSTPVADAQWHCAFRAASCGDKAAQLRGCENHVFNPKLLNGVEYVDGSMEDNYAHLRFPDGRLIKQGPNHLTSVQLCAYGTISKTL